MKILSLIIAILFVGLFMTSCQQKEEAEVIPVPAEDAAEIAAKVAAFAPTTINTDISFLSERQQKVIEYLVEAAKHADKIFWMQSTSDGLRIKDSLETLLKTNDSQYLKDVYEYLMINYGPYDLIHEGERFVCKGPEKKPKGANFYPADMTKEEFEKFIEEHPDLKEEMTSQYTVIERFNGGFKAVPFHKAYADEVSQLVTKLRQAAEHCDNPSLKKYIESRATAIETDNYYESDLYWMELADNDIDVIIGPIENYEDAIYNYKTAYEAVVMVKDKEATETLQMYRSLIDSFEQKLPSDPKYIRESVGGGQHILNFVNVVYMGGDCQAGTKTIACNLPNDPKVREIKGGKNTMYKNMMEAKFDKIVIPIGNKILTPEFAAHVDKKAFMDFVTLHEISHSLGRDYVYGNEGFSVRNALKERYSAIEETKADILSIYNHKHLLEMGKITEDQIMKTLSTYLPGLYRSIRFGAEEAHGKANLIQLNYLRETGAIERNEEGKFSINKEIFFDKVGELAKLVLDIEAEGDYAKAGEILNKYGVMTDEIKEVIASLKDVPRDLDTKYEIVKK
jgi:hypothetical protein